MGGDEHGIAQWIVPTDTDGGRRVRRGKWVKGVRGPWVSYPVSAAQTRAFVDAFEKPTAMEGLHAEMIADGFPHLPDGVDNTDPAVKMIVSGILRSQHRTAGEAVKFNTENELAKEYEEMERLKESVAEAQMLFDMGKDELHRVPGRR